MEDRITPGLYLELGDRSLADHRARATALLASPEVTRATVWTNQVPGRTDLPRRIPEGTMLSLFEVGDGFTAPSPGTGSEPGTGLHFRQHRRPGQGRLTGRPTIGLSVVLISPRVPGDAEALRDWADFVHIAHIAAVAVPGYAMITPFVHATGGEPRFLHLYEMDSDDPEASFQAMTPLVERRLGPRGSAAFDEWAWHPALRIDYVNTFRLVEAQVHA